MLVVQQLPRTIVQAQTVDGNQDAVAVRPHDELPFHTATDVSGRASSDASDQHRSDLATGLCRSFDGEYGNGPTGMRTGSTMIAMHTATALVALLVGGILIVAPKGTRPHRYLGWSYAARYWHAVLMPTSVLMIAVTGIVQFFDRLPFASDALNAIVFLQLPGIVGFVLIARFARGALQPTSSADVHDSPP